MKAGASGENPADLTGIKARVLRCGDDGRIIGVEFRMTRLSLVIFSIASVTLMGIAVVVALVAGLDTLVPIVVAAAIGLVLSVPTSWLVARRLI